MNQVNLCGRLTKDPVQMGKSENDSIVARYTIAVHYYYKDKKTGEDKTSVDFIPVVSFGKTANFVLSYLKKGSAIIASGCLKRNSFISSKTKKKEYVTDVVIDSVEFAESKADQENRLNEERKYLETKIEKVIEYEKKLDKLLKMREEMIDNPASNS